MARFRLEVQLKTADWTVRPMEVRVTSLRVPDIAAGEGTVAPIDAPADAAATAVLAGYLAGEPLKMPAGRATLRDILRRNAVQDLALGTQLDRSAMAAAALDLWRVNNAFRPRPWGSEWWLKLRDWIFARR